MRQGVCFVSTKRWKCTKNTVALGLNQDTSSDKRLRLSTERMCSAGLSHFVFIPLYKCFRPRLYEETTLKNSIRVKSSDSQAD